MEFIISLKRRSSFDWKAKLTSLKEVFNKFMPESRLIELLNSWLS